MGIQRQSLPTQPHRLSMSDAERSASPLLSTADFKLRPGMAAALPMDILDAGLIARFKRMFLEPVDRVGSFWNARFRAMEVTRVPLKLPPSGDGKSCPRCGFTSCSCFMDDIIATQADDEENVEGKLAHAVHMSDPVSGSPDGLLNFFPMGMKRENIGSNAGLSRILAEFNIENCDDDKVKMVNTDVQIYERIIKVRI